ncbi:hypothetical protein [Vibrio harveyi]|uniref:hypothetical protein n=1 Tax=Vibrio harveyi TaxID=669 RepID=UPI003CE6A161
MTIGKFQASVQTEFEAFKAMVHTFWQCSDKDALECMIADVFNQGLSAGKFWVESCARYNAETTYERKYGKNFFESRQEAMMETPTEFIYDHIEVINRTLLCCLGDLTDYTVSNLQVDYRIKTLAAQYQNAFWMTDLLPIEMSKTETDNKLKGAGCMSLCSAGEWTTIERLIKEYVDYRFERAEQSALFVLISAIFSHGLYTARHFNNLAFTDSLLSIYNAAEGAAFTLELEGVINEQKQANAHLGLILDYMAPIFVSNSQYKEIAEGGSPKPKKADKEYPDMAAFIDDIGQSETYKVA